MMRSGVAIVISIVVAAVRLNTYRFDAFTAKVADVVRRARAAFAAT